MRKSLYIPGVPIREQGNVERFVDLCESMGFTVKLVDHHRVYRVYNRYQQTEAAFYVNDVLQATWGHFQGPQEPTEQSREDFFHRLEQTLAYVQKHPKMPSARTLTEAQWIEKYGSLLNGPEIVPTFIDSSRHPALTLRHIMDLLPLLDRDEQAALEEELQAVIDAWWDRAAQRERPDLPSQFLLSTENGDE